MRAKTRINRVTMFRNGALVVRRGRAPAGAVEVDDLPPIYDRESLRVQSVAGRVGALRDVDGSGLAFELSEVDRPVDFEVEYFVEAVRWAPTIVGDALLVAQATGEDWSAAQLRAVSVDRPPELRTARNSPSRHEPQFAAFPADAPHDPWAFTAPRPTTPDPKRRRVKNAALKLACARLPAAVSIVAGDRHLVLVGFCTIPGDGRWHEVGVIDETAHVTGRHECASVVERPAAPPAPPPNFARNTLPLPRIVPPRPTPAPEDRWHVELDVPNDRVLPDPERVPVFDPTVGLVVVPRHTLVGRRRTGKLARVARANA